MKAVTYIPIRRIMDRLDTYLEQKDYDSAERLLKNWVNEAENGNDLRGKLAMVNEQIGFYRKQNKETECMQAVRTALEMTKEQGPAESVMTGTIFINAATGYKAFGKPESALPLYRQAREIYEHQLKPDDERLAGLYNNMALALVDLGEYAEAETLYGYALSILEAQTYASADEAVTFLNMADLVNARDGAEAGESLIQEYLTEAEELLESEMLPRDGYYAFVCEKCAPVFGYYGRFLTKQRLLKRASDYRAGSGET